MTIEECRENHKKLWMWISNETLKVGRLRYKDDYFEKERQIVRPWHDSFVCAFARNLSGTEIPICKNCPIDWDRLGLGDYDCPCMSEYSPYWKFKYIKRTELINENNYRSYSRLAEVVANLPFKEGGFRKMRKSVEFYKQRIEAENWPKEELCDPPTPAQFCLNYLINNILGEDWCVTISENTEQTNTAATYDILEKCIDEVKRAKIINWSAILLFAGMPMLFLILNFI